MCTDGELELYLYNTQITNVTGSYFPKEQEKSQKYLKEGCTFFRTVSFSERRSQWVFTGKKKKSNTNTYAEVISLMSHSRLFQCFK